MSDTRNTNNELFNLFIKEQYFKTISEATAKSYRRIFKQTAPFESALGKDIYKFNFSEIEKILFDFKGNNRNTIESYARVVSGYLNWCVRNHLITHNVLENMKPVDFEKYLIGEEEYITEKKLRRYEDMCVNYQDAVILRLLFVGICGRQCSEIRNLKWEDIDQNTLMVKLTNSLKEDENGFPIKYTERYVQIDQRTFDLIKGAYEKDTYVKRNGQMEDVENIRSYTDLVRNNFIIRPSITRTDNHNAPADKFVIYRRIKMLSNTIGIKDLSTKLLQRSGMIYKASQISKNSEITIDDIKVIANIFDIKSYHNLKAYVTMENVQKLYGNAESKKVV